MSPLPFRSGSPEEPTTVVLEPAGKWPSVNFAELWRYRDLFFFLVWRDIKVRYAQTVLGALWAVFKP
ncbi:MAG: ABC transporter permease, partial [Gemmatimonadota bacterium]